MTRIFDFETCDLEIGRDGSFVHPQQRQRVLDLFSAQQAPDMWLISHGWNNDMDEARNLYWHWLSDVRAQWNARQSPKVAVQPVVVQLFWPSKKFADRELIPGQAASLDDDGAVEVLTDELRRLRGFFDHPDAESRITQLLALLPQLADSPAARAAYADQLRTLLQPGAVAADGEEDGENFATLDGAVFMERLEGLVSIDTPQFHDDSGGAANVGNGPPLPTSLDGHAAGLFGVIGGAFSAAYNALNLATYYQMKKRAGMLGAGPLAALLREIAAKNPALRMHLAGHSFGARLCTAAICGGPGMAPLHVQSLTLMQAAFSQHGFAPAAPGREEGCFRRLLVEGLVRGPILATHSRHDIPVGLAYPLASRLAGDAAASLGDANSPYGGLGRNGAQKTPGVLQQVLAKPGASYGFPGGTITNLDGDKTIFGHSDICKPEVAYAFACAADA